MTEKEQYRKFKKEWQANHSLSPAPSFSSWKDNYKDKYGDNQN